MGMKKFVIAASLALLATALEDQLKRPRAERDWRGTLGPVPYDLRPPTVQRIRNAMWNPDNPSVVAPRVFGVGWTLNLYRVFHPRR
ncbi:MAG: DUF5808 domain-containing protein [Chloroflexota bacterium]|nr:DUF5808 domain-containing protein [Chloroflexota bacterium]